MNQIQIHRLSDTPEQSPIYLRELMSRPKSRDQRAVEGAESWFGQCDLAAAWFGGVTRLGDVPNARRWQYPLTRMRSVATGLAEAIAQDQQRQADNKNDDTDREGGSGAEPGTRAGQVGALGVVT